MEKLTKSQVIAGLAEKSGMAKKDVKNFLDVLAGMAYSEVKTNGQFVLPGFGKMVKVDRKARVGINPATGEKIQIPAKTSAKFRLTKAAKEAILK